MAVEVGTKILAGVEYKHDQQEHKAQVSNASESAWLGDGVFMNAVFAPVG